MGNELNRNETVEKSIREYLMYHPINIDTLLLLAETLLNMGKAELAEEELRKILIFDPGNKKAAALKENVS